MTVSQIFFVLMTLTVLRRLVRYFVEFPSDVFLMIRLVLRVFWRKTPEGKVPFSSHYQNDLLLLMLTKATWLHTDIFVDRSKYTGWYNTDTYFLHTHVFLSCFCTVNSFFSFIFILHSLEGDCNEQPTLKEEEVFAKPL